MAENLIINGENKRELYETLLHQLQSLTAGETDVVANMANVAAALKQTFDFFWVGFYVSGWANTSCRFDFSQERSLCLSYVYVQW